MQSFKSFTIEMIFLKLLMRVYVCMMKIFSSHRCLSHSLRKSCTFNSTYLYATVFISIPYLLRIKLLVDCENVEDRRNQRP